MLSVNDNVMDSHIYLVFMCIYILAYIKGIASQKVLSITPSPTATVTENDSTTLTCTYSQDGVCPNKQILFTWYLNDVRELELGWTGTTCIELSLYATNLSFSCRSVQTYCEIRLTLTQVKNSQHGDTWKCQSEVSAATTIFVNGIASQKVLSITPSPTATVTENDSTTLTCTYSQDGVCPNKQILFTWYLNDVRELELGWTGTTCIELSLYATNLSFSCRSVQTYCEIRLTLTQVKNSQHGDTWKCQSEVSAATTIFVNVPLTAVQLTSPATSSVSVVENVPYNVVCQTSAGRPQATVQWYKRSGSGAEAAIPGGSTSTESSGTLIITRSTLGYTATKADEGHRIYCKASNVGLKSFTSSRQPVMSILYAPVTQTIPDKDVVLALPLTVPCFTIAGNPPHTSYRWTRSGDGSWSQTGQTLSISRVEKTDAGDYTCTAWNVMTPTGGTQINGEVSKIFTVNVLYAPVIQPIQNRDVLIASALTVQCVTTAGNPPQTSYRWTRSGDGSWSQTGQTLRISRVEKTDAGVNTCTAWNVMTPTEGTQVNGEVSRNFTLNVLYPPVIHPIKDRDVLLASPLTVTCFTTADNPPQTSYRWTRSGDSSWSQTGQTLNISRVEKTDAGDYTCTAWNVMIPTGGTQVNGEVSTTFTLNVLYKASATSFKIAEETGGGPYIVDENSQRTFRCEVDSNPASEIQITRAHGTVLAYKTNTLSVIYSTTLGCHDSGKYECKGYNTYNGDAKPTAELELFVRCHPRAAELNITVYKSLHESVTLNRSVTAYPPSTYRWFKANNGGWVRLPSGDKQAYLTIENLQKDDFRQYKVEVTNGIPPDLELYYVIEAARKPKAPFNFTVLSKHITLSSVLVQWSPGFSGGPPQVFYIEYKRKEDLAWTEIEAMEGTAINKTITGLVPNTHYVVRMYARNSVDRSNITEALEFKTLTPLSLKTQSTPLGGIIGGTVAGLLVIVLIAATVFVLRRFRMKHRELVDSQQNSSRDAYETLQRSSDDPRVYDDLHQTEASKPESNVYEKLQHGEKNVDGVYDELDSKVDNQINDDSKVYVNMEI